MTKTIFKINSYGISDVGLVREQNEDRWAAFPEYGLFILADGMGGHLGGEVAAEEAVDQMSTRICSWPEDDQVAVEKKVASLREAILAMNAAIYKKGQADESLHGMGTTLCLLYTYNTHAILAHVGDSRIYRLRDKQVEQLTEDHSLVNELMGMGVGGEEDAETCSYKNILNKNILTRAVGTQPKVKPSIHIYPLQPDDLFMLCSDGLTNYVSKAEIGQLLTSGGSLQEKAEAFVSLAKGHGGGDNITLILVNIGDDLPR